MCGARSFEEAVLGLRGARPVGSSDADRRIGHVEDPARRPLPEKGVGPLQDATVGSHVRLPKVHTLSCDDNARAWGVLRHEAGLAQIEGDRLRARRGLAVSSHPRVALGPIGRIGPSRGVICGRERHDHGAQHKSRWRIFRAPREGMLGCPAYGVRVQLSYGPHSPRAVRKGLPLVSCSIRPKAGAKHR